ncbi:dihydrodipicolinate reductase C-terminal domain-containing protein [uncultured Duncaniella sp.]|uniref:4-hydroxy-tetrahydrodipicolinate reductase n=1 Tax=uncultured Duncaniella sp. TaxID=2768039 RepID=UPI0025DDDA5B|nr:dihydrodipicolinate reductase C-terminal domain-containing protein [uncultured Duncaniella sp.]
MKIALIGYGKMGHAIERIARERGHEIVSVIDVNNNADIEGEAFASADAAIEFTTPATAPDNVMRAAAAGVPVVCGSTGWAARRDEVEKRVSEVEGALLASSNFSIGVNVFNIINRKLAALMSHLPQYMPHMYETHHVHKLDHPSGTAITLAEGIIAENERVNSWADEGMVWIDETNASKTPQEIEASIEKPAMEPDALPVLSFREGEVPGTHTVDWDSPVDCISITHRAKSRDGFALGAVMAAEWIAGRKGIFTIDEMMAELL